MKPSYSTLQRKIRRLKADIATLEQWKKEQMIVAADTHYHDIARAIGLKLDRRKQLEKPIVDYLHKLYKTAQSQHL